MIDQRRRRISQSAAGLFVASNNRDEVQYSEIDRVRRFGTPNCRSFDPHRANGSIDAGGPTEARGLTDNRIQAVKNALQLTREQMKYRPAIEEAVRARADGRRQNSST